MTPEFHIRKEPTLTNVLPLSTPPPIHMNIPHSNLIPYKEKLIHLPLEHHLNMTLLEHLELQIQNSTPSTVGVFSNLNSGTNYEGSSSLLLDDSCHHLNQEMGPQLKRLSNGISKSSHFSMEPQPVGKNSNKHKRIFEEDMPWYNEEDPIIFHHPDLIKTQQALCLFANDPTTAKNWAME
ncbi:hypothetical protein BDQ17DRAFT_1329654 [Cyathus striatus]|nr:hypothetical protein BDQ17DRAFT_1329654 [Cyathus striatus]